MHLIVTTEYRFQQDENRLIFSNSRTRGYSFWARYLKVFDSVTVMGRLFPGVGISPSPVEGPHVSCFPLPSYSGPIQYLWKLKEMKKRISLVCSSESAIIIRSGFIGNLLWGEIQKSKRPFGIEVVGDPHVVFSRGSVKHPFRSVFRWWFPRKLRGQCAEACAAAYVTKDALQKHYPPSPQSLSTYYSNVELDANAFISSPRRILGRTGRHTIVSVGSLAQLYKAPDVLIDAVGACVQEGFNIFLIFIGDGKYKMRLEEKARKLGLGDRVRFIGQLPAGDQIRSWLDQADLFVLPSRSEGLPRALIEAMARGLPCIGTRVGGIPELLTDEDMVPPDSVYALKSKICEVLDNPARMARMSTRNMEKSKEYREENLVERRIEFYRFVRDKTEEWIRRRG